MMPELRISTPIFTGELALLVKLIRAGELDVMELPLSTISGQVLAAVEKVNLDKKLNLDLLAEGALLTSQLALQKTQAILGERSSETSLAEDSTFEDLELRLRIEAERRVLVELAQLVEQREVTYTLHGTEMVIAEAAGDAPEQDEPSVERRELELFDAEAELEAAASTLVPVDLYPQREMADEILALLAAGGASLERFRDGDPARLVAAFLALLELVRSRVVIARQTRLHGEILLERVHV